MKGVVIGKGISLERERASPLFTPEVDGAEGVKDAAAHATSDWLVLDQLEIGTVSQRREHAG